MTNPMAFMRVFLLLNMIFFSSCEDNNVITNDPANLLIEITLPDDGSGLVKFQAQADNAIEYQIRIGSNDTPVATNTTGTFEYTFIQTGYYQVDIRAYGSSGRWDNGHLWC